jgi:DNA-binding GntR family transcriptional regulator
MDMSVEKETKIDEVVAELQRRIQMMEYVAGQRLPSERVIAETLRVSRVTVRAALLRLQSENLIDIVPKSGAFVRAANAKAVIGAGTPSIARGPELKQSGSFIRAMEAQGRKTFVRLIEPSAIMQAGDEIGTKLGTGAETLVLRRYRIHLVERIPYRILDSYYLASLLGGLLGKDEGYVPLFKWLREHIGLKASRVYEQLRSRMPTAREAALLNIARNQPVIDLDRWIWADDGTLFEYTHIIANAALHEFTYSYEIDEEASR